MTISEKIKTIGNKIEQNKAKYDLDRQVAKISALSLRNDNKYDFFNWQRCFTMKRLARKSCFIKKI